MFARRSLMLGYASTFVYPRRSFAASSIIKSSYRDIFQKSNEDDKKLVIEKYKKDLTKTFGHSKVIENLKTDTIEDLHWILVMYKKPLSPERRISLRKTILPYLESSDKETQMLFEYILKYYNILP